MHVLREPDLSDTLTVSERGEAAFPKLGIMQIAQLTILQLQDTLRQRYSAYLRNPALEVIVLRRIVVNGEVDQPNVYWMEATGTVRDAIALAGGISEQGDRGKVYIVRQGERTRVRDWERSLESAADLQSGDQVIVERKNWLALNLLPAISTAVVVAYLIINLSQ